ncbi:hypothetical protein NQ317_006121 [Molorchus minor]|uniref:Uncharacterized protein n=1 Tax=Molorchus minor TaxID=1323400 RepID=A0ABQ9JK28_9CUCU|nr:hypothetical protein NQ317_006121 [Molorchus minor]
MVPGHKRYLHRTNEYTTQLFVATLAIVILSSDANVLRTARDYIPETNRNADHNSCCIIPTCDEYGKCYETLSCGYICS